MAVEIGLGQQASAIVERLDRWMAGQEKVVRETGCWSLVRDVVDGAARVTVPASVPAQWRQALYGSIMASAVVRLWTSGKRTVFPVHPHLVGELEDSTSGELPGVVFERLPRPNPLVLFPEPLAVVTPDGHRGQLLGFFVYGRGAESKGQLCSTDAPIRQALGIMAVTSLVDEHGKKDIDLTRFTLPIGRERFTIGEATENTLKDFAAEPGMALMSTAMKDWVSTLTRAALHVLLYLCSEQPDIATRPERPRRANTRAKDKAPKPPQIYNVGWNLGPALFEARRTSGEDPGPATFRTVWAGETGDEATVLFQRADEQLDEHLASTTAELTELRQALHEARRDAESLRARTIDLETQLAGQQHTINRLNASRLRLARAALRYRTEAATTGHPEHLDMLQHQLRHRDDQLTTATSTIGELTTQLQHAQDLLDQRAPRYGWPSPQDPGPDHAEATAGTAHQGNAEVVPGSWTQLCTAAAALPQLWCNPELADLVADLPERRDWLTTTWRALCALSAYAESKEATRAAGQPLTPVRNFLAYLQGTTDGPKISAAQLATHESETVLNNQRLRNLRARPVPAEVDASETALHLAHIRIGQTPPHPRLHFLDATDQAGLICIGYLGPHLPNTKTN